MTDRPFTATILALCACRGGAGGTGGTGAKDRISQRAGDLAVTAVGMVAPVGADAVQTFTSVHAGMRRMRKQPALYRYLLGDPRLDAPEPLVASGIYGRGRAISTPSGSTCFAPRRRTAATSSGSGRASGSGRSANPVAPPKSLGSARTVKTIGAARERFVDESAGFAPGRGTQEQLDDIARGGGSWCAGEEVTCLLSAPSPRASLRGSSSQ